MILRQIFKNNGDSNSRINHWPKLEGGPPLFLGTWGKNVKIAASNFDGWIASAHYRTTDEVINAFKKYKNEKGQRAIVSTIQVSNKTDIGELKEKLTRFSEAGFDDAIIMFMPGAPSIDSVRKLV